MGTELRTSNRTYKYEGRRPGGAPCCKSNDMNDMCDDCRRQIKHNAGIVPAAKRLADAMQAASGKIATSPKRLENAHGVPAAPRLSDVMAGAR